MPYLEVDPGILGQVAAQLTDSVAIAHQVRDHRDTLKGHVDDAGHDTVRAAVHSFLDRWAHGCACLTEDARQLADRLGQTSRLYVQTETAIAEGFGGGA